MGFEKEARLYAFPAKSETADYAGRSDLIAEVDGHWEGAVLSGVYLLDWKSSKKPYLKTGYPEWAMQNAAYRKGAIQTGIVSATITGCATVRLDKFTGIPSIYDYSDIYEERLVAFEHLVRYYRATNSKQYQRGVPSVTTILGVLEKPALVQWAANCARDYILQKVEESSNLSGSVDNSTVQQWAEEAAKNFRKVSKKATDIGTEVHELIEADLKGSSLPRMELLRPEVESAFLAYQQFKDAVNLKPLAVEFRIYGYLDKAA